MFKNIQKQLLIKYPLLWNTRVVPMTAILIVINLIFFFVGYQQGKLNFNENENNYNYDNDGLVVFFSVFVSIILIILWLVFYFKNNSFKSFYPKTKFSLFKEWCVLLFISFLISLFTVSFYYGKETRVRGYYTETEAKKRCETLSKASFFIDGSYSNNFRKNDYETEAITENEYISFNGKQYNYLSLLNKNINSYSFFNFESDSLRKKTIKNWLVNQQKDSIKNVFKEYLKIAKEHKLKANIDENKWFDLVYDYPNFEDYKLIGKSKEGEEYYVDKYTNGSIFDSVNKYIIAHKDSKYEYYKYYVPESNLNYNYNNISNSWNSPTINFETILIAIYFALGISLLIFSFRVTSGKNWLISVVSIGVLGILFGIISFVIKWDYTFPILVLITILFTLIYFTITLYRSKSKNISGIIVNVMLWSIPGLLPLLYFITIEILNDLAHKQNILFRLTEYSPAILFMQDNAINFFYFNLIFTIIIMIILSSKLKKWRSLAEN